MDAKPGTIQRSGSTMSKNACPSSCDFRQGPERAARAALDLGRREIIPHQTLGHSWTRVLSAIKSKVTAEGGRNTEPLNMKSGIFIDFERLVKARADYHWTWLNINWSLLAQNAGKVTSATYEKVLFPKIWGPFADSEKSNQILRVNRAYIRRKLRKIHSWTPAYLRKFPG